MNTCAAERRRYLREHWTTSPEPPAPPPTASSDLDPTIRRVAIASAECLLREGSRFSAPLGEMKKDMTQLAEVLHHSKPLKKHLENTTTLKEALDQASPVSEKNIHELTRAIKSEWELNEQIANATCETLRLAEIVKKTPKKPCGLETGLIQVGKRTNLYIAKHSKGAFS